MDSHEDSRPERIVIPLAEERVRVDVRPVERERLTVRTTVETREEIVERALRDEELVVERVPIGREVAEAPAIREEDGVLIVPVLEEELVVRTRLVLKEELHVRRREIRRVVREPVRLRREVAEITRDRSEHAEEGGQQDHGTDD